MSFILLNLVQKYNFINSAEVQRNMNHSFLLFHDFPAAATKGLCSAGVYGARRESCSAVKQEMLELCHHLPSAMKIQLRKQQGWNLEHGFSLAAPAVLCVLQKHPLASVRRGWGWPAVVDECDSGHGVSVRGVGHLWAKECYGIP